LEKDLEEYPHDGFLHYVAGMGRLELGDQAEAEEELRKAWGLAAENQDTRHIALGAALELAESALKEAPPRPAEVTRWVERAEEIDEQYPRCLYLRGRLAYESGELDSAIQALDQVMSSKGTSLFLPIDITTLKAAAAALLGRIYIRIGKPKEAVSILTHAKEMLRGNP
jgi:tetratricopeptide (TPR) repeat protein